MTKEERTGGLVMIIDRLENLEKYAGAVKGLAPAARFLEGFVKTDMTPGRYELATAFEPPKKPPLVTRRIKNTNTDTMPAPGKIQ